MMPTVTTIDGHLEVEEVSITALYRAHAPEAVRLAYLLTGDAAVAQDIAQDAFLKTAGRIGALRSADRFEAYLRRTVVRCVLMRHRSETRRRERGLRAEAMNPSA